MNEWVLHFPVHPRVEHAFSRDEIELAAKIAFFQSIPDEQDVNVTPSRLNLQWSESYLEPDGTKLIRVSGDVGSNDAANARSTEDTKDISDS